MRNTVVTALVAGAVAVGSVLAAGPAAAVPAPAQVFSVPYSDVLYVVVDGDEVVGLTYEGWSDLGFPAPTPAATEYGSYPWSPVIYAVSPVADVTLVNPLTPDEWARVGRPMPIVTELIPGTAVIKWASSDELFAGNVEGSDVHKLTFAEWARLDYLAPEVLDQLGFYQLAWSDAPGIAFQNLGEPSAVEISFEVWQENDFPTPAQVNRIYSDTFTLEEDGVVVYDGPTLAEYPLSFEEWEAAGFPLDDQPS